MKNARTLTALIAIMLLSLAAIPTTATETVSPGAIDRLAQVNNACPTFSWGAEGGVVAYDLVAYVLPDDASHQVELTAESEALYTRVSGGATSWTPSADQCFAPGGRYVWFVRSVTELAGDEVVAASEWSAGRYFTVPDAPSPEEIERAIEVMNWLEATGRSGAPIISSGTGFLSDADSDADSEAGWASPKSVPTASAAIRGEHPDISGEKYGVVGVSSSLDGAGLAAVNLGSGPDLVLDGSVDGETDLRIWEWGIDRASSSDEVFQFNNSAAGVLHLDVEGDIAGSAVRASEVVINGSTVIDGTGAWTGAGDMLPCPGCVSSTDIAAGAVTGPKIAAEAVSSLQIEDGGVGTSDIDGGAVVAGHLAAASVTTVKLADGAVTAAKLAPGAVGSAVLGPDSVGSSHIVDGAVATADLAVNAVDSTKILNASIQRHDLADDIITSPKIADGSIAGSDLGSSVITGDKIADGAVDSIDLADGAVTSSKVGNGAVTSSAIRANAVSSTHVADGSLTAADLAVGAVTGAAIADGTVTGADIAADTITATQLAAGAVYSSNIANGTITAADVSPTGGVYVSKSAVYVVSVSVTVPAWLCNVARAYCNDPNDLPLFGFFDADIYENSLERQEVIDWDSETLASSYLAEVCNRDGSDSNLSVSIVCVAVPGS